MANAIFIILWVILMILIIGSTYYNYYNYNDNDTFRTFLYIQLWGYSIVFFISIFVIIYMVSSSDYTVPEGNLGINELMKSSNRSVILPQNTSNYDKLKMLNSNMKSTQKRLIESNKDYQKKRGEYKGDTKRFVDNQINITKQIQNNNDDISPDDLLLIRDFVRDHYTPEELEKITNLKPITSNINQRNPQPIIQNTDTKKNRQNNRSVSMNEDGYLTQN